MKTIIIMIIVAVLSVKAILAGVDTLAPTVQDNATKTDTYLKSIGE